MIVVAVFVVIVVASVMTTRFSCRFWPRCWICSGATLITCRCIVQTIALIPTQLATLVFAPMLVPTVVVTLIVFVLLLPMMSVIVTILMMPSAGNTLSAVPVRIIIINVAAIIITIIIIIIINIIDTIIVVVVTVAAVPVQLAGALLLWAHSILGRR